MLHLCTLWALNVQDFIAYLNTSTLVPASNLSSVYAVGPTPPIDVHAVRLLGRFLSGCLCLDSFLSRCCPQLTYGFLLCGIPTC